MCGATPNCNKNYIIHIITQSYVIVSIANVLLAAVFYT